MERGITFINPLIPPRNVALRLLSPIPAHTHPQNLHTHARLLSAVDKTRPEEPNSANDAETVVK